MLAAWQGSFGKHKNIAFWRAATHCIMWCLWWEWNARSFEGYERSILEIKSFFFGYFIGLECFLSVCSPFIFLRYV